MAPKQSRNSSFGAPTSTPKINRKGINAKRGTSQSKSSKNYQKPYRGQGRGR